DPQRQALPRGPEPRHARALGIGLWRVRSAHERVLVGERLRLEADVLLRRVAARVPRAPAKVEPSRAARGGVADERPVHERVHFAVAAIAAAAGVVGEHLVAEIEVQERGDGDTLATDEEELAIGPERARQLAEVTP